MFVDNTRESSKLKVNLDIMFPRVPCDIMSLDVQDIMGNHQVNVGGSLLRRTFDKNGVTVKHDVHVII